jgi:RNA-directed DNA polymerase
MLRKAGKQSVVPPSVRLDKTDTELAEAFRKLSNTSDLADLLEVPLKTLAFFVYKKQNYKEFAITKRGGGIRFVATPDTSLKLIQRKLGQVLMAVYGTRGPVHGFVRNRSVKTNAQRHLGARWLLNFDLKDFFPSIHYGRVAGLFSGKAYALPTHVAALIARICCYKSALPVGAPTSPVVANMICAKLDAQLKNLAWASDCTYTRYADDMSISTKAEMFPHDIVLRDPATKNWVLSDKLVSLIQANTFEVNPFKTRVRSDHSGQQVTGIRINAGLNVSKDLHRQVRAMLHAWKKFGEEDASKEYQSKYKRKQTRNELPDFKKVVRGKIEFIGFVRGRDHLSYVALIERFHSLHPEARVKPIKVEKGTHTSVIEQAIWLMENNDCSRQGTAFAIDGKHLLTAAHVLNDFMYASRPSLSVKKHLVQEKIRAGAWFFLVGSALSLLALLMSMLGYGWKRVGLVTACLFTLPFWYGLTWY